MSDEPSAETPRLRDTFTDGESIEYEVRRVLYEGTSPWQRILIADLVTHGRTLFLDGNLQSAEHDEHHYHEALVHPAMLRVDAAPRSVAILGGGEGATLREVLRYPSVERAAMIDLDDEVVRACREHLPGHHRGAFDDPRAEVIAMDAEAFLRERDDRYDVIVFDIVDPADSGPASHLFERPFFELMKSRLNDGGVVTMQVGPAYGAWKCGMHEVLERLRASFDPVDAGRVFIPAFHGCWGVVLAGASLADVPDDELRRRLDGRVDAPLRTLDVAALRALFTLPVDLRA